MELSFYPKWKCLLIKILPVPRTGIEEICSPKSCEHQDGRSRWAIKMGSWVEVQKVSVFFGITMTARQLLGILG